MTFYLRKIDWPLLGYYKGYTIISINITQIAFYVLKIKFINRNLKLVRSSCFCSRRLPIIKNALQLNPKNFFFIKF